MGLGRRNKHKTEFNTSKNIPKKKSLSNLARSSKHKVPVNSSDLNARKKNRVKKPRHKHVQKNNQKSERQILIDVLHQKKMEHFHQKLKHGAITNKMNNKISEKSSSQTVLSTSEIEKKNNMLLDIDIHRIRNLDFKPKSIICMASSHPTDHSVLTTSREGGSVEMYDPNQKWRCIGQVPGMPSRSVDALTWLTCNDHSSHNPSHVTALSSTTVNNKKEVDPSVRTTFSCNFQKEAFESYSNRRLFGASIMDGTIFEIDFAKRRHKNVIGSGGGAVYSLISLPISTESCSGYIAAGCEDGIVRIYYYDDNDNNDTIMKTEKAASKLELVWALPTTGAPVLSLALLKPPKGSKSIVGSILYAGIADGTIRKYECVPSSTISNNYQSIREGHTARWKPSFRMTLDNLGLDTPTKVWALQVLSNNTLISGDSLGQVQFWDGATGIVMQSFKQNSQSAPVLDIAVDPLEEKVFVAGVDSRVICIEKVRMNHDDVQSNPLGDWILTHAHRPHSHDVRGLAICCQKDPSGGDATWREDELRNVQFLCSGGVDTKICTYSIQDFKIHRPKRMFHMPFSSPIALATKKRVFTVMRDTSIDFYKLKDKASHSAPNSEPNIMEGENENGIGSIGLETHHNLICCDISQDGTLFAVSDSANLMLFEIEYQQDEDQNIGIIPNLLKLKDIRIKKPCSTLQFSTVQDETRLFCGTMDGPILVVHIQRDNSVSSDESNLSIYLEHTFTEHLIDYDSFSSRPDAITQLVICPNGKYLAAGRNIPGSNSIHVFALTKQINGKYNHHFAIPALEANHSALRFTNTELCALVIGCVNNTFHIFEMESKKMGDWTKAAGFPSSKTIPYELVYRPESSVRLLFNPSSPNRFILVSSIFFY